MMLGKRFQIFIVVLFVVFAGLSTFCYGDPNCGFDSICPYVKPPCYKLVISDCEKCPGEFGPPVYVNGTWWLPRNDDISAGDCEWCTGVPGYPDYLIIDLEYAPSYGFMTGVYQYDGSQYDYYGEDREITGTDVPSLAQDGCNEYPYHDGIASWEPIWDCSACGYDCMLDVNVSGYKDPLYYARVDCCPPAEKGEDTTVTFTCTTCTSDDYVIPTYKIEIPDPNDPNSPDWIEVTDSNLVDVNSVPAECSKGTSVSFHIQALKGLPPARARVTVTGSFYDEDTGAWGGASRTVAIEPDMPDCCDSCGGGGGGGPGGGCPGGSCSIGPSGFGSGPPPPGTSCPILLGSL